MEKTKIWLSSPHMGGTEQKYVQDAFDSNWVAPLGPNVTGFEKDLEEFLEGTHHIAALSSGTAAIHLALIHCGVSWGDEVICQSFTFCGSINPVKYLGAQPVLIDSEADTWNMDPELLEEAIIDRIKKGKKPKAIIAVHLYGMPFKVAAIQSIAHKYEIPLIEDSAEALGSTYDGIPCGIFGDYGILSFNGNKIITTSGGGALVCMTEEDKQKTVFLATQARDNAPHYQHSTIGYNYRLSNISAGIGRGQMEVLKLRVVQRRKVNAFYRALFKDVEGISFQNEPTGYFSNYWLTALLIDNESDIGFTKEDIYQAFAKENIESRPLWKPMHLQPIFSEALFYSNGLSERLFDSGLCLPSGSNMDLDMLKRIENCIFTLLDQ